MLAAGLDRDEHSQEGLLLEAQCDVAADQGAWHEAGDIVATARRIADEGGLVALWCFADRLEGLAAEADHDAAAARTALARAADGFTKLDARWEVALCDSALARVSATLGDHDASTDHARRARAVFEELGAQRELEG